MPAYRFGKHPRKCDYRTLHFKHYLTHELAPPPPSYNVLARVSKGLKTKDLGPLFPMNGNDTFGNCTIAAVAHAITTYRGLLGSKSVMPSEAVLKLYMHLTGGVDTGLHALNVLNHWRKNPVSGDKILAFTAIDFKNREHVQHAIRLFGGVFLGFQVQQDCTQQFRSGHPWTPAPLTQHGHCVFAVGYDQKTVTMLTWGSTQKGTWAWWDECVDEAYAILPEEAVNPVFAPGFNIAQLRADLHSVARAA